MTEETARSFSNITMSTSPDSSASVSRRLTTPDRACAISPASLKADSTVSRLASSAPSDAPARSCLNICGIRVSSESVDNSLVKNANDSAITLSRANTEISGTPIRSARKSTKSPTRHSKSAHCATGAFRRASASSAPRTELKMLSCVCFRTSLSVTATDSAFRSDPPSRASVEHWPWHLRWYRLLEKQPSPDCFRLRDPAQDSRRATGRRPHRDRSGCRAGRALHFDGLPETAHDETNS